ncbi:MAG: hypothetical protein K8R59_04510, partial [Thermoanaerobaculales bacterium]|nr:hypothetical protein [Thermoanaerobaculales bacterium]
MAEEGIVTLRQTVLATVASAFVAFALVGQVFANPLWEWVNPLPQGHPLSDVVAVEGVLVTVGYAGTVVRSIDGGETWSIQATSDEYQFVGITWANGRFIAVGGQVGEEFTPVLGVILSSEDGITWVERHRVEWAAMGGVCWNGAHFVAVSIGGKSFTSDDGLAWREHELPSREWSMGWIVWTGAEFVSIGRENFNSPGPSSFTSPDGIEWQMFALDDPPDPTGLAFDGEKLLTVRDWEVLISHNGIDWEVVELEGLNPRDVIYANGLFVTVGGAGQVATSSDGYAWSIGEAPTSRTLVGVTWDGSSWVAVGDHGVIVRSTDAETWEQIGSDAFNLRSSSILDLAWGGGRFVGVGEYGLVITST